MPDPAELPATTSHCGQHPRWCDPRLCFYSASGADDAYLVHGAVLEEDDSCVVELMQRDVVDAANGGHFRRGSTRVIITFDGLEELDVPAERAGPVGAMLTRVAMRLSDGT